MIGNPSMKLLQDDRAQTTPGMCNNFLSLFCMGCCCGCFPIVAKWRAKRDNEEAEELRNMSDRDIQEEILWHQRRR